MKLVIVETIYL